MLRRILSDISTKKTQLSRRWASQDSGKDRSLVQNTAPRPCQNPRYGACRQTEESTNGPTGWASEDPEPPIEIEGQKEWEVNGVGHSPPACGTINFSTKQNGRVMIAMKCSMMPKAFKAVPINCANSMRIIPGPQYLPKE